MSIKTNEPSHERKQYLRHRRMYIEVIFPLYVLTSAHSIGIEQYMRRKFSEVNLIEYDFIRMIQSIETCEECERRNYYQRNFSSVPLCICFSSARAGVLVVSTHSLNYGEISAKGCYLMWFCDSVIYLQAVSRRFFFGFPGASTELRIYHFSRTGSRAQWKL
jgi:hypothetical protein